MDSNNNPKKKQKEIQEPTLFSKIFSNNGKLIVGILVGVIIGWLFVPYLSNLLLENYKYSISFIVGVLSFAILVYLVVIANIKRIQKKILPQEQEVNVSDLKSDLHQFSDSIMSELIDKFYTNEFKVSKSVFKKTAPKIGNYFIWIFLRGWGYRQILALFGLLLTFLTVVVALQQNKLVEIQNKLVEGQNKLVEGQNELIQQDIILNDANTKSSYVALVNNIFEQIADAKKDSIYFQKNYHKYIEKVILINSRLKPYRYFKEGKLIEDELSPERGLLLTYLVKEGISKHELDNIVFLDILFNMYPDWRKSELDNVDFGKTTLEDINLSGSSLVNSNLINTDLRRANLSYTDLRGVKMGENPLPSTNLIGAKLDGMIVPAVTA